MYAKYKYTFLSKLINNAERKFELYLFFTHYMPGFTCQTLRNVYVWPLGTSDFFILALPEMLLNKPGLQPCWWLCEAEFHLPWKPELVMTSHPCSSATIQKTKIGASRKTFVALAIVSDARMPVDNNTLGGILCIRTP